MGFFGGGRRRGDDAERRADELPASGAQGPTARPSRWPAPVSGSVSRDRADGSIASGEGMANIGKSITISGDLTGNEDLVIEGKVEGKIELPSNQLTIGPNGQVKAEVHAKSVVIVGRVTGNVNATERVEIQASGVLEGDVRAPRLAVEEGAVLNGSVSMGEKAASPAAPKPFPRPAAAGEAGARG